MTSIRRGLVLASLLFVLIVLLWRKLKPHQTFAVNLAHLSSNISNAREPGRAEGNQTGTAIDIPRIQFSTKHEIPWGGVLPIPQTKKKVWIDIGTNINPIVASSPDVYMILVDPIPNLVAKNAKTFPSPMDVAVVWSAISNATGTAKFNVYNKDGKSSSLGAAVSMQTSGTIDVPLHTLEELINMIPKKFEIELLKTDMQGFDLVGLKSARTSLTRVKIITFEFSPVGAKQEYFGPDNSKSSAQKYLGALGFSQLDCGNLDCQFENANICKSHPSSCAKFHIKETLRICRQYTVISTEQHEKCKRKSVTPYQEAGDACTVCKPFLR